MINSSLPPTTIPVGTDDYIALQRLVHRYADAVVHRDAGQWGRCWADDAVWELGPGRSATGREAIVEMWTSAMGGMEVAIQTVDNGDAWREPGQPDDVATGRWYVTESFRRDGGQVGVLRAHYDDQFVRRGGEWLFAGRRLRVHYHGAPDLSGAFVPMAPTAAAGGSADA